MALRRTKLNIRWRNMMIRVCVVMTVVMMGMEGLVEGGNWCVARSNASEQALQTALDYACAAGADCEPIQSMGFCFLPNTLQAHASYAFNSYYQKRSLAPGACEFSGTATIAMTDPSYGSCVYPSSTSTAGGAIGGVAGGAMGGGIGGGAGGNIGGGGGAGGGIGGGGGGTLTPGTPSSTIINNPNTPMTPPSTGIPIYGGGIGGYTPGLGPTTAGTTYGSHSSLLTPSIHLLLVPLISILVILLLSRPYEL